MASGATKKLTEGNPLNLILGFWLILLLLARHWEIMLWQQ